MTAAARQNLSAVALALLLGIAWTIGDWNNLAALNLPDTDDIMRLQQVRDWIAGQGFADVSQHRLAGGLAMHWSRIGDLVPAALIVAARPFTGQHAAEVAAVIAWPIAQFVALMMLTASIARIVAPKTVGTATVLAALAYPASSLFLPGRIDHHALQLLLVLVQVRALLVPPFRSFRAQSRNGAGSYDQRFWTSLETNGDGGDRSTAISGAVAGLAVAIGAAIGLETLPFAVVTGAVIVLGWLRDGQGARLTGFGLALAGGIVALTPIAAHGGACDTFQPLAPVAVVAGLALSALGRLGRHRLPWLAATVVALAILGWTPAQPCLAGPYASVDPLVARLWLAQVQEAQPLFSAPLASAIAYGGLLTAGLLASLHLARTRGGAWWLLLAYQGTAAAITCAQIRGAYLGALLAVLPIAVLLGAARTRGALPAVLALWIAGTGLSWSLLAGLTQPKAALAAPACTRAGVIARLNALPPGRVIAGIDLGSYILAGTRHSVVAAPYHRNDPGNRDLYRFFLGPPQSARAIAERRRVDYVVICPGDLGAIPAPAGSIADGARPGWLHPISPPGALPAIYRLSPSPRAR